MDNFYLYIFILICFIFGVSYLNTYLHDYNNEKKELNHKEETNEPKPETNEPKPETK